MPGDIVSAAVTLEEPFVAIDSDARSTEDELGRVVVVPDDMHVEIGLEKLVPAVVAFGSLGPPGPVGPVGPMGPTGDQGIQGETGPQGEVYVRSTVTLPAGSPATVVDTNPSAAIADLEFGIPQGIQGVKGDKGDPGTNGTNGAGVPAGGTANQMLTKKTATDFDTQWSTPAPTTPSGPAGGDLAGTYPNPTLAVDRVKKTGDSMTGYLDFVDASFRLKDSAVANRNIEWLVANKLRWTIGKTNAAESGSNAGTALSISAWDDAGAFLGTAVSITRATQLATVKGDPTAALGIATKQYVDNASASVYNTIFGDATNLTYTITHNKGRRGVQAVVFQNGDPWERVDCVIRYPTTNTLTVVLLKAPGLNAYQINVM